MENAWTQYYNEKPMENGINVIRVFNNEAALCADGVTTLENYFDNYPQLGLLDMIQTANDLCDVQSDDIASKMEWGGDDFLIQLQSWLQENDTDSVTKKQATKPFVEIAKQKLLTVEDRARVVMVLEEGVSYYTILNGRGVVATTEYSGYTVLHRQDNGAKNNFKLTQLDSSLELDFTGDTLEYLETAGSRKRNFRFAKVSNKFN